MRLRMNLWRADRRLVSGLLLVGLLLLPGGSTRAGQTEARTLFVASDGNGTACTQAVPCDLPTGVAEAAPDDVIYVAGGTYTGSGAAVVSLTKTITLLGGWDGAPSGPLVRNRTAFPTILDGQNQRRGEVITGYVAPVVDGFIIVGGVTPVSPDFSGAGIKVENASPIIRYNEITGNHALGDGGAIFVNRGAAQILHNQIHGNTATWAAGLRLINDANVTVIGNEIRENVASIGGGGIDLGCCGGVRPLIARNLIANNDGGSRGGGVIVDTTQADVVNNILVGNQASLGAGVWLDGMAAHPTQVALINNTLVGLDSGDQAVWVGDNVTAVLANNILAGHSVGIVHSAPVSSTVTADHNLFWNGSDPLLGIHPVLADPLLDAAYHLTAASPARDAGTPVDLTVDFDGDPRPIGGYDIGADEYALRVLLPLVVRSFP